jgi:hypothetical protein
MERAALQDYLTREPFKPFTVLSSNGERYIVSSPDAAMLLKSRLLVAPPPEKGDVPDRFVDLSLLHITGVEEPQAA